jgi:hypothetical protein
VIEGDPAGGVGERDRAAQLPRLHILCGVFVSDISIEPPTTLSPSSLVGEDQGGDGQPRQGHRGEGLPLFPDKVVVSKNSVGEDPVSIVEEL